MIVPIIGFVPIWIVLLVVGVVLLTIFSKKLLHILALIFIAVIGWWLYHRFF